MIAKKICTNCGRVITGRGEFYCCSKCMYEGAVGSIRTKIPKDVLTKLYVQQQVSADEVARRLNVCSATVKKNLRHYGISVRGVKEAMAVAITGSKNPNWKGGRYIDNGYVRLYCPDHPRVSNKRYVFEHHLIWERHYDMLLPDGWLIHHINGIKTDNRIENLQAMPKSGHHVHFYTHALQERIRELEAALEKWSPLALSSIENIPDEFNSREFPSMASRPT